MKKHQTYIALLRGINVGGHHKVPMAELRKTMEQLGFTKVITLLNSGNVIFDASGEEAALEEQLAARLEKEFGFPIPVLLRTDNEILQLHNSRPFEKIEVTPDTRLYVSFLKQTPERQVSLPWTSEDGSYRIISIEGRAICSVLDVSVTNTPKGMDAVEQLFGKTITTRNWNTIERIAGKMK